MRISYSKLERGAGRLVVRFYDQIGTIIKEGELNALEAHLTL